jgi:hypothetical protein
MSTTPRPDDRQSDSTPAAAEPIQVKYEKPALTEYGPLAKITQGAPGSTGESGNFTMRMCL